MMALRFATAAYVAGDVPPAVVLSRLNTLLRSQGTDLTASAVFARYRPATKELPWAPAGHLPLLLATRTQVLVLPNPYDGCSGLTETAAFEHDSIRLHPGELIIGYGRHRRPRSNRRGHQATRHPDPGIALSRRHGRQPTRLPHGC